MYNVTHTAAITEGQALNQIFKACRANEEREDRVFHANGVQTGRVSFRVLTNGDYEATLRDHSNIVVAVASVDEFDI